MFRYVIKFIHPDKISNIVEEINFETKERAEAYIQLFHKTVFTIDMEIIYMNIEEPNIKRSRVFNEMVNDYLKEKNKE